MDIALIGLSIKCSEANNSEDFLKILKSAEVCIGQPTEDRIINSKIDKKQLFYPYGYMDRNDFFDYSFFNLSKAEADAMDPAHRMLLEAVCESIENSGYNLEYLANQRAGLFVTAQSGMYNVLYQSSNSELDFIGGLSSMAAGRIAYFLNIEGPVMNIDTACSSSLVAIHEAVQKLKNNELDIAVVGGARILYQFNEQHELSNDAIMTSDGQCRAFDNDATGTAGGEGVSVIVLKRLDQAIQDRDNILSVIKGSAINHDGNSSNGITAPSPTAQTSVLLKACKNSQIPVSSIGYIETHGTGTKLGDPIEYKAIKNAFSTNGNPYDLRLGTLKPNIGHLDNLSGLVGLIKTSLVLREKEFFPLANFNSLNKFIEADPNITVRKDGEKWISDTVRRAGVSSFGLSGTNSHVVLEEYIAEQKDSKAKAGNVWFKISAKSKTALENYIDNIEGFLSNVNDSELNDISGTLNEGRLDYNFGVAVYGQSAAELRASLLSKKQNLKPSELAHNHKIALVFLSDELRTEQFPDCPYFKELYAAEEHNLKEMGCNTEILETIALQVSLYRYFLNKGFSINNLICNGALAKVSKEIIDGKKVPFNTIDFKKLNSLDFEKLKGIASKLKEENTLLVIVGSDKKLTGKIKETLNGSAIPAVDVVQDISKGWAVLWSEFYNSGIKFNWKSFYANHIYYKKHAPTYPFERNSCWNSIKNPLLFSNAPVKEEALPIKNAELNEEELVVAILQETLQNTSFQLTDDFFELGGNSIIGIQFINRINDLFKINIEFDELFNCYEINDIIGLIRETRTKDLKSNLAVIPSKEIKAASFGLSNSQKRMWVESQTRSLSLAYNINMNFTIEGDIELKVFKEVLKQIVIENNSFRTVFAIDENGSISQKIVASEEFNFDQILEYLDINDSKALQLKVREIYNTTFDLENGPLFKAYIIKLQENKYQLLFSFHHIIFDGWSAGIFMSDFVITYKQLLNNSYVRKTKKSDYFEYVNWLTENIVSEKMDGYKLSWQQKLKTINTKLNLGNSNTGSFKGQKLNFTIESKLYQKFNEIARKNRATLFSILLSSVRVYLYRLTQENCLIGTPVSGRTKKDFESVIGLFVNTIPLYTEVTDEKSFEDCVLEEMEAVTKALEYQTYPFDSLLENLQVEKGTSLFDIMVVLQNQNNRSGLINSDEVPFKIEADNSHDEIFTRFNLTFTFFEVADFLDLELEYNTDVFDREYINSFMDNFFWFAQQLLESPDTNILLPSVVNKIESEKLLVTFNDTQVVYPEDKTIISLFEEQAERTPNKIAVVFEGSQTTYKELNEKSNQFANYLKKEYDVQPDDFIGIKLERSGLMIVAILGILKSGAAYVPIDTNYPLERIDFIKEDSNCKLIVEENTILNATVSKFPKSKPEQNINPGNLAYVIYTSGSTGTPKGVLIEHKSLIDYVQTFVHYFQMEESDSILSQATIAFDTSIEEIFPVLTVGGTLVIVHNTRDFHAVFSLCEQYRITFLSTNPFVIQYLNSSIENYDLILRKIISGGDVLKAEYINNLYEEVEIYNTYGPTEATVCATYHKVTELAGTISIGRPINNKKVYILHGNALAPIGVNGELCIGGKGLARGYLNNEALTIEKFVDNPFVTGEKMYRTGDLAKWTHNGSIDFMGRIDNQLKIRGYRIELEEIEKAIMDYNAPIKEAIVDAKIVNDEKTLVAYIVSRELIDKAALKNFLKEKLPPYMIPSFYINLDKIALTHNGKIDRKALPAVTLEDIIRNEYVQPANETEERVASIWQENLNVDKIGTNDNFFELGGQSIIAVKVIAIINREFNTDYPLDILFHVETIHELSEYIINGYDFKKDYYEYGKLSSSKIVFAFPPILGYGTAYKNLFNDIAETKIIAFNFLHNLTDIVSYYANQINKLQPEGDIILFGWSAGGNLSYDVANYLLEKLDRKVSSIIMLDSYAIGVEDSEIENINDVNDHIKYDLGLQKLYQNDNILENAKEKLFHYLKYMHGIEYKQKNFSELVLIKSAEPMGDYNWESFFDNISTIQGKGEHYSMLQDEHFSENKKLIHDVISKIIEI